MANQHTNPRQYKIVWNVLFIKCNVCWEWLKKEDYPKDKDKLFWVRSNCKKCQKVKMKAYHEKWYEDNKEKQRKNFRNYHESNKDRILERNKNKVLEHTESIWFDRYKFHDTAKRYVRVHNLRPKQCTICWEFGNIEMHHPSYKSFEEWSKVVFCCKKCHRNIHNWYLECPKPIDLLECDSPTKETDR